jgi:hypothetical protein
MNVAGFAGDPGSGKSRWLNAGSRAHSPGQLPQATLRPVLDFNDADAVAYVLLNNRDRFHYSFNDRPG